MEEVLAAAHKAAEDACHYALYWRAPPANPAEMLAEISAYALSLAANAGYIWQRDPFSLSLAPHLSPQSPVHLEGKTRFGDCIDDEWFILWLLQSISLHYPDLVISLNDNDGEFLLIEAAEVLPRWVTPENAEHRVCGDFALCASLSLWL